MKRLLIIFISLALTACAGAESSAPEESAGTENTPSPTEVAAPEERTFTAKITGYRDRELTFEYEGREQTLPLWETGFQNDCYTAGLPLLSEQIINNRFGQEVTGRVTLNSEGDRAVSCDVVGLNGEMIDNFTLNDDGTEKELWEYEVRIEPLGGSLYELTGSCGSVTVDINDLASIYKADIGSIERGCFSGYRLTGGGVILESLGYYAGTDENGVYIYESFDDLEKYSFFGRVTGLSEGRAQVLLTDGVTVCDVPDHLRDGELREGQEVMLTLEAGPSLYGSGGTYTAGSAVIHTDPGEYNAPGSDFASLAYARYSGQDITRLIYTKREDIT